MNDYPPSNPPPSADGRRHVLEVGWRLVFGFLILAVLQVVVPTARLQGVLSPARPRAILLASLAGIASSSCSYASAAIGRTLFQKGAHLIPGAAAEYAGRDG